MEHGEVLPDRQCGECNVCCIALTIDDDELQKLPGYRCKNLQADHRCGIYATRPRTCSTFECGWRILKWVRPTLRPDRSGVLIRFHVQVAPDQSRTEGVIISFLNRGALKAEGLAETVAAVVNAGVPLFLSVPGPPGHTSSRGRIDEALMHAVVTKDKAALLTALRIAYNRAQGSRRDYAPVKLRDLKPAPSAA